MAETTHQQAHRDALQIPPVVQAAEGLYGGFDNLSIDTNPRTADGDFEAVGPVYYWSDGSKKVGVFENDEYDDDGYPYTVATWIVPYDGGDPYWQYTRIAPCWESAIRGAEMESDFRAYIRDSKRAELYPEWQERTGGTDYEPGPFPWDDNDDEDEQ